MAVKAEWLIQKMEAWAPGATAENWDNVGLLIGDTGQTVKRVLVALDVTEAVVAEAVGGGFDWIISHHPMIFNPLNRITAADSTGRKIMALIKNNIGLFAAHTNLDIAEGGTNDILFEILALNGKEPLMPPEPLMGLSLGCVGFLPEAMTLATFINYIKQKIPLSADCIRYAGDTDRIVHRVAICAGDASGQRYCEAAIKKGCDVYVTGDLRYHGVQDALESGLSLVDITHYAGEAPLLEQVAEHLRKEALQDDISIIVQAYQGNGQVFKTFCN